MKKLFAVVIIFFVALNSNGQDLDNEKEQRNELAIEVSDFLAGTLQIRYERLVG